MSQCTAPIRGHRTESGRRNCPVCGRMGGYIPRYSMEDIFYTKTPNSGRSAYRGNKQKAKWSPVGSRIMYSESEIIALTPIRRSIVSRKTTDDMKDVFLCHAWDDRKYAAKELCDQLIKRGVSVWFSERDVKLGTTLTREIDKGLARSRAGIVLVTPSFLDRIKNEGLAEKELSALLARDLLVPIVYNTTFEELRNVSPLLGSRSGLSTEEDSMDVIASKIAELFSE